MGVFERAERRFAAAYVARRDRDLGRSLREAAVTEITRQLNELSAAALVALAHRVSRAWPGAYVEGVWRQLDAWCAHYGREVLAQALLTVAQTRRVSEEACERSLRETLRGVSWVHRGARLDAMAIAARIVINADEAFGDPRAAGQAAAAAAIDSECRRYGGHVVLNVVIRLLAEMGRRPDGAAAVDAEGAR